MISIVSSYFVKVVMLLFLGCVIYGAVVGWLNMLMSRKEKKKKRQDFGAFDPQAIEYLANSIDVRGQTKSQRAKVKKFLREHREMTLH